MAQTFAEVLARQDQLIARRQALQYLPESQVDGKLGSRWRVILPGIYATFTGELTPRQRRRAALLHAGDNSLLTDLDALCLHQLPDLPQDPFVRVLVRDGVQRMSREFVRVRRTTRMPAGVFREGLPVVPVHRAWCEFAARHDDERNSLAIAATAIQLTKTSVELLAEDAQRGPARGRPRLTRIINALDAGVRSAPEGDFRELVLRCRSLPEPLWNSLIQMPDGQRVSPDSLFVDAGLVHETNGRRYHAAEDQFESMQRRNDALVTAGLTVLHNSPRRIATEGRAVIAEVESCYRRLSGRGLPPGVVILRPGPPGTPRAM